MHTNDEGRVGTFTVDCSIQHPIHRERVAPVDDALVDTGSELTWIPASILRELGIATEKARETFIMADGRRLTRDVGFVIVRVGDRFTIDEVVFGEAGDLAILGARSLEGMNLAADPRAKRLVSAGPIPAARAAA